MKASEFFRKLANETKSAMDNHWNNHVFSGKSASESEDFSLYSYYQGKYEAHERAIHFLEQLERELELEKAKVEVLDK